MGLPVRVSSASSAFTPQRQADLYRSSRPFNGLPADSLGGSCILMALLLAVAVLLFLAMSIG